MGGITLCQSSRDVANGPALLLAKLAEKFDVKLPISCDPGKTVQSIEAWDRSQVVAIFPARLSA